MSSHAIAKTKLKKLTSRTERSLYQLKYSSCEFIPLTDELYTEVLMICTNNKLPFPLIKNQGKIYLNTLDSRLYSVLHELADNYNIVLDYSNVG